MGPAGFMPPNAAAQAMAPGAGPTTDPSQSGAFIPQNLQGGQLNANAGQQMAPWQRGLMAALTGNQQYGQGAPGVHQAIGQLLNASNAQQQQPQRGAAPMMQMRRPMGQAQPINSGNVPMPTAAGAGAGASMAPWLQQMMQRGTQ